MSRFSVLIPAYNEIDAIESTLRQLDKILADSGSTYEMVVVDDGSTDGTSAAVRRLEIPNLVKRFHPENLGYGAAVKTGILASRFDILVITDADRTYPNECIPRLVAEMDGCDMVVGARTGEHVAIPFIRRPAKWAVRRLGEFVAGRRIPDMNSGLRAFRREPVEAYLPILPDGYSLTTTITLAMLTNGHTVKYIPVNYFKRIGKSKIRPIRDTLNFLQLILRTAVYFNPLKVFIPLGLLLLSGGLVLLLLRLLFRSEFLLASLILFISAIQVISIGLIADLITRRNPRVGGTRN